MSGKPALAGLISRLYSSARQVWFGLTRWVSRSLQVQVVVATIILTSVAVYGVGAYMSQQIARGLFEARLTSVSALAEGYVTQLEGLSLDTQEGSPNATEVLTGQVKGMLSRSSSPLRSIVLVPQGTQRSIAPVTAQSTGDEMPGLREAAPQLMQQVSRSYGDRQFHQSISLPNAGGDPSPGLVVGQLVSIPSVGEVQLYAVADLSEEQKTLDFVHRAMWVAAMVLLVLVGAVAWIVTRLVVSPVKAAAEVSRKLADGDLDRRMPVRGNDEIATLATSFNEMAETLQSQITRMEQLSVLQRQFVSDVSHELRTPLSTIRIASDMMYQSREDFDATSARSAELLHSQVDRFDQLLGDLLEISRHDAGAAALVAAPLDILEAVDAVRESVLMFAERVDSRLVVHAPSGPVMADFDNVRVQRVLRNLMVNAIEHGEGRDIDIYIGADPDAVAVSVRDHGTGMSNEQVEHVFDRFWRADPARRRTLGGSGLGLAISLEDAHLHHGWLQAWGRTGEGSCFRLTIPRRAGKELRTSPLPLPPEDAILPRGETDVVAGPTSSDGSVRLQTGSIPIVVARDLDTSEDR